MACMIALAFLPAQISEADEPASAEIQNRFFKAGQLYDEGQFHKSASAYQQLIDDGFAGVETLYNYGNALFRMGLPGKAMTQYRRAWLLNPRDPDINANMRFAMESSGAVKPAESLIDHVLTRLALREWLLLSTAALWALCGLAILYILLGRPAWPRAYLTGLSVLLAIAIIGSAYWIQQLNQPEGVIVDGRQKALFAPVDDSTPAFSVAPGSIVRILESNDRWFKIKAGEDIGWIPANVCNRVHPQDS